MPRLGSGSSRASILIASAITGLLLLTAFAAAERDYYDEKEEARLKTRIQELKRSQRQLADLLAANGHPAVARTPVQAEQGIVIAAGGRRLLTNAYVVIKVIREAHRSRLPIEVFYDGPEEADAVLLDALQRTYEVQLRDASQLPRPDFLGAWPATLHGYAKKVFALYSTGFRQVLVLDADNQPLLPPDALFKLPEFAEHGAVFWPDYWTANSAREAPQAEIYELLGLSPPWWDRPSWAAVESGQILFDKLMGRGMGDCRDRHADCLDWVMWLNLWADPVYEFALGDKDTFEMGFMLAGKHAAFHRVATPPRTALTGKDRALGMLLHVGMVQSIDGRPAFLHRTSGGKFDADKSVNEHLRPALLTEPMSVPAARRFVWDAPLAINTLDIDAVPDRLPPCRALDPLTIAALRPLLAAHSIARSMRHLAKRYAACKEHRSEADAAGGDITALPFQLWGQAAVRSVSHSYIAFQELRGLLRPPGQGQALGRKQGAG